MDESASPFRVLTARKKFFGVNCSSTDVVRSSITVKINRSYIHTYVTEASKATV